MFGFKDVIGHEHLTTHLQSAISMGKVSHAYIFDGEKGSGKNFLADIFAAALQCENSEIEPCGNCTSCKQAEGRNHPDIIHVGHEKPNSIGVEDDVVFLGDLTYLRNGLNGADFVISHHCPDKNSVVAYNAF